MCTIAAFRCNGQMSLRELITAILLWIVGLAYGLLTTVGGKQKRKLLKRFVATICLWAVLAGACFSYGFLRHSSALYLALFLLVGWYFVIPSLLTVVSVTWFVWGKVRSLRSP